MGKQSSSPSGGSLSSCQPSANLCLASFCVDAMIFHRNHFQDPSASVSARTNSSIILISVCESMGTHQLSIRKVANIIFSVVVFASPEATAHIGAAAPAACVTPPVVQRMNQLVGMGGKACIWQPCLHKVRAVFRITQFHAASWRLRGLWKTLMLLTDKYRNLCHPNCQSF